MKQYTYSQGTESATLTILKEYKTGYLIKLVLDYGKAKMVYPLIAMCKESIEKFINGSSSKFKVEEVEVEYTIPKDWDFTFFDGTLTNCVYGATICYGVYGQEFMKVDGKDRIFAGIYPVKKFNPENN